MSQMKDGGPAFPIGGGLCQAAGMTLRDYFAARAMAAELTACSTDWNGPRGRAIFKDAAETGRTIDQVLADNAYKVADAMLRARALPSPPEPQKETRER